MVEASAGSGKTYCLAVRYLKLLLNNISSKEIPHKNIIALTFSNKAAVEMKERILEFLKRFALDQFLGPKDKENLLKDISADSRFLKDKAFEIIDKIVGHYNLFRVQTIDSFVNALLCGCAFKFHLSSSFQIKSDYRRYLEYSFDKLIDAADKDASVRDTFLKFLRQYLYLENKKSWFPKQELLSVLVFLFNTSNIYGAGFCRGDKSFEDLLLKRKHIRALMAELKKIMPEGANRQTWGAFIDCFGPRTDAMALERFFAPFSKDSFAIKKGFVISGRPLSLWQELKTNIQELRSWEAFSLFDCYLDVFERINVYFREFSQKDDVIFLPELNKRMRELLSDEDNLLTIPELYYRLAACFSHYLIDEFQDTSLLQWRNLFPMIEDALSSGGTLFYVGDKKQAIYRFRGGEAGMMDRLKLEFEHFNVKEEFLNINYRSHKEVVEFNNHIFSPSNIQGFIRGFLSQARNRVKLSDEQIKEITDVFKEARQAYKEENSEGFVSLEVIDSGGQDNQDMLREKTINLIERLKGRFELGDIAVLARSNEEVELYTSWLIAEGMAVESEKTLNAGENPHIKELTAFLRFLNSPIDNLAFAAFIVGDIFTKASGMEAAGIHKFIFNLQAKERRWDYLYVEFRDKFTSAWKGFIEDFYKNAGIVPLYELLVSIFDRLNVLKNFPNQQGFFMKLLEIVKASEEQFQGIGQFLEYFENAPAEDLYVQVSRVNAVKAMTIHKSKGLEFPVVIIPSLEINAGVSGGIFVSFDDTESLRLGLLTKDASLDSSSRLNAFYREELKKALIDELNCVYVGFSRPKYELYAFIPVKANRSVNPAVFLFPEDGYEAGRQLRYENNEGPKQEHFIEINPSQYRDWTGFLREEFLDKAKLEKRRDILRGEAAHYALSLIGNLTDENYKDVLKDALAKAGIKYPSISSWREIRGKITGLVNEQKLRHLFFAAGARVYQEKEIVDAKGRLKRIDRLVISEKEAWVIDYKSSAAQIEKNKEQVRGYLSLLKKIHPTLKITGLIIEIGVKPCHLTYLWL